MARFRRRFRRRARSVPVRRYRRKARYVSRRRTFQKRIKRRIRGGYAPLQRINRGPGIRMTMANQSTRPRNFVRSGRKVTFLYTFSTTLPLSVAGEVSAVTFLPYPHLLSAPAVVGWSDFANIYSTYRLLWADIQLTPNHGSTTSVCMGVSIRPCDNQGVNTIPNTPTINEVTAMGLCTTMALGSGDSATSAGTLPTLQSLTAVPSKIWRQKGDKSFDFETGTPAAPPAAQYPERSVCFQMWHGNVATNGQAQANGVLVTARMTVIGMEPKARSV